MLTQSISGIVKKLSAMKSANDEYYASSPAPVDLNLLPVFDAVYRSRSVRLAAEELAMSTSALSHALSRLRSALNDPLFYREGHRMCPSVYASQLAPLSLRR